MILYWGGATYKIVKVNLGRGLQQPRPKGRCLANFYFLDLGNDHELVGHDHGSENKADMDAAAIVSRKTRFPPRHGPVFTSFSKINPYIT